MTTNSFIPCGKCNNGYLYTRPKNDKQFVVRCDCLTEYLYQERLRQKLISSGIPMSILDYTIDSYIGEESLNSVQKIQKFVRRFSEKFSSVHLYLTGPNGTQKTTIAHYLGRELLKQGHTVRYVLMNEMIKNLTKEGFEKYVDSHIEQYYTVDCLIVDEAFDKDKILWYRSNYQMNFLDSILRKRIDQLQKSIVFVSNKSIESIKDNFNYSIYDLVKRNTLHTTLPFVDHYTKKDDFDPEDLWKD